MAHSDATAAKAAAAAAELEKTRAAKPLYVDAVLKSTKQTVDDVSAKVLEARKKDNALRSKPKHRSELPIPADNRRLGKYRVVPRDSRDRQSYRQMGHEHVSREGRRSWVYYEMSPLHEKTLWLDLPTTSGRPDIYTSKRATWLLRHSGQVDPKNNFMEIHRFHDLIGKR